MKRFHEWVRSLQLARHGQSQQRRRQSVRRVAEQLEVRTLPAGTVAITVDGANITVTGDARNNVADLEFTDTGLTVSPDAQTSISVNGVLSPVGVAVPIAFIAPTTYGNLTFVLNSGNDVIRVLTGAEAIRFEGVTADLGNGNDQFSIETGPGDCTIAGPVSVVGDGGNDVVVLEFAGSAELQGSLTVDLGRGTDTFEARMGMTATGSDLSITGEVRLEGGAGNDLMRLRNFGRTIFTRSINIVGGPGKDVIEMRSEQPETRLEIFGSLVIDTGNLSNVADGADSVLVNDRNLSISGELRIATRNGMDRVTVDFGGALVGDPTGLTSAFVGRDVIIDTGIDGDFVSIFARSATRIAGELHILTGIGRDEVNLFADDELVIERDLVVNTDANDDRVRILADGGTIIGNGDADIQLGHGNDCLLLGSVAEFADAFADVDNGHRIGLEIAGNLSILGDRFGVAGNDQIGLHGVSVSRDLTIQALDGNNVMSTVELVVGNSLLIDGGRGLDQVTAIDWEITGTATIRTGLGNDQFLADNVRFESDVLIDLGARNDLLEFGNVTVFNGAIVTVDGGQGVDRFDSAFESDDLAFVNFESDLANVLNEVDGAAIERTVLAGIQRCYQSFSFALLPT